MLTLVSDVAANYFRLIALDQELAIAKESAQTYKSTLDLFTLRFEAGRDSRLPVERAQSAYVQAIDKLAADAKPQLENPDTPLLANYREKLLVLDSAIDDLRAQTGQNPSNAHLRYELLAMYQEKQRTLEEILEEKR
jgi:hypothetical protein